MYVDVISWLSSLGWVLELNISTTERVASCEQQLYSVVSPSLAMSGNSGEMISHTLCYNDEVVHNVHTHTQHRWHYLNAICCPFPITSSPSHTWNPTYTILENSLFLLINSYINSPYHGSAHIKMYLINRSGYGICHWMNSCTPLQLHTVKDPNHTHQVKATPYYPRYSGNGRSIICVWFFLLHGHLSCHITHNNGCRYDIRVC